MTSEVSASTLRRLMKEYQAEQEQRRSSSSLSTTAKGTAASDENIVHLAPKDPDLQDLLKWEATIKGPVGGFYEGA